MENEMTEEKVPFDYDFDKVDLADLNVKIDCEAKQEYIVDVLCYKIPRDHSYELRFMTEAEIIFLEKMLIDDWKMRRAVRRIFLNSSAQNDAKNTQK